MLTYVLISVIGVMSRVRSVQEAVEIEFTVAGKRIRLTHGEVTEKLSGLQLGQVQAHAVEVSGALYPVKEAFALVTGLDLLDFNTNQARSIFRRLGFNVVRLP